MTDNLSRTRCIHRVLVTWADPETLILDPNNVRRHPDPNRDALRRSIKRFGIRKPVVAHEGTNIVYAGNLTIEVAIELGYDSIPVAWIPKETPESVCQAYAIADNRTADLSEFDDQALSEQLQRLAAEGEIEFADLGFDESLMEALTALDEDFELESEHDTDDPEPEHECPKCGYQW